MRQRAAIRKATDWSIVAERARQPGSVILKNWLAAGGAKAQFPRDASFTFGPQSVESLARIFGGGSYTGRSVTDEFSLAVSTVWRCVQLKAQTVGSLPWAVYERLGPGKAREVDDHPLSEVLVHSPNADMDRMQFREALEANMALRNNAVCLKETRGNGTVSSLTPLPSRLVTYERDRETGAMRYKFNDRGREEVYPAEKIWHVRGFSFDGRVGLPPMGYGRHAIALAAAAEEFGSRFFANGARVSGIVKIPEWLEDDQRAKAKKNLQELYGGLENAHKLGLLEGGMEYSQMSATPGEAQHNELRGFQVVDICRFFGVPPHLVYALEHGSYNNVETLAAEWVTFGLLPDLVRIELAAQKQLLVAGERKRFFVRFNFEGLLRANSLERSQFYASMLQNGVFSRNEVREKENLARVDEPGMDERTVQTNLALIQFIEAMAKTGAAAGRGNNPTTGE
jgi:HK97 family phage portal protein